MVNIFGEVPIVLNTDYKVNSKKAKNHRLTKDIWRQIITDAIFANENLDSAYVTTEKW